MNSEKLSITAKQNQRTALQEDYQKLVDILYSYHLAGGPLHIVTDDDNLEDQHLDFCQAEVFKSNDDIWLKSVMFAILHILYGIPEDEREDFVVGN